MLPSLRERRLRVTAKELAVKGAVLAFGIVVPAAMLVEISETVAEKKAPGNEQAEAIVRFWNQINWQTWIIVWSVLFAFSVLVFASYRVWKAEKDNAPDPVQEIARKLRTIHLDSGEAPQKISEWTLLYVVLLIGRYLDEWTSASDFCFKVKKHEVARDVGIVPASDQIIALLRRHGLLDSMGQEVVPGTNQTLYKWNALGQRLHIGVANKDFGELTPYV